MDEAFIELKFVGTTGSATLEIDGCSTFKKMAPDRYLIREPGKKLRVYFLSGSTVNSRDPLPQETFDALPDLDAPKGSDRNP